MKTSVGLLFGLYLCRGLLSPSIYLFTNAMLAATILAVPKTSDAPFITSTIANYWRLAGASLTAGMFANSAAE